MVRPMSSRFEPLGASHPPVSFSPSLRRSLPVFAPGSVWLTGAGPGDPGLLTLQAAWGLAQADVVFFDALVNEDVLAFARPGAELAFVGKRAGCPSPKQSEINARLIEAARAGRRVLRLKGGDPYVFGRGAEEAQGLVAAGVPFRVAPGVTAGVGGLAAAGIPVTHRDVNQSVTFLTAHDASGSLSARLDWGALSAGSPVLVVYMGFRLMHVIADKLIEAGRPRSEPAAIVAQATTPRQKTVHTTLGALKDRADLGTIEPPVLLVIGGVVALAPVLAMAGDSAGDAA